MVVRRATRPIFILLALAMGLWLLGLVLAQSAIAWEGRDVGPAPDAPAPVYTARSAQIAPLATTSSVTNSLYLPLAAGNPAVQPAATETAEPSPTSEPTTPPSEPTPEAVNTAVPPVDLSSRAASQALFDQFYTPFSQAEPVWTGDHANCLPGTTAQEYRDRLQNLVNYFRSMAGVPADVRFSDELNAKAQAAALMMSVNRALNHFPPADWLCYSQAGAEAAGKSNLSYWYGYGSSYHGIIGQMEDNGGSNYAAGHRRWILYPQTTSMGTGDVPWIGDYYAANALWVIDNDTYFSPRPQTREPYVAWPPPGYVPHLVVYDRWSFSFPGARFEDAQVTMRHDGTPVPVELETPAYGYGEPTLVWRPALDPAGWDDSRDHVVEVTVDGVMVNGEARSFSYSVTIFAPER